MQPFQKQKQKKCPINRSAKLVSSILTRFVCFSTAIGVSAGTGGDCRKFTCEGQLGRQLASAKRDPERVSTAKESQLPVMNPHQNCPPGGAKGTVPHLEALSEPMMRRSKRWPLVRAVQLSTETEAGWWGRVAQHKYLKPREKLTRFTWGHVHVCRQLGFVNKLFFFFVKKNNQFF